MPYQEFQALGFPNSPPNLGLYEKLWACISWYSPCSQLVNSKYEILKLCSVMDPISDVKKLIPSGSYAGRELISMLEGMVELNQFEVDDQVTKMNKLKGITEITLNLDELNNSNNLKDGRPSNSLLTYYVTDDKDFTRFEPQSPQYKKLKNGKFTSLALRITDQNNNVITDGLQVTVVLHIRDRKI